MQDLEEQELINRRVTDALHSHVYTAQGTGPRARPTGILVLPTLI